MYTISAENFPLSCGPRSHHRDIVDRQAIQHGIMAMARKKPKGKSAASMVFNVTYEDGAVTSNRRISNQR